jgi:hypothetical protein
MKNVFSKKKLVNYVEVQEVLDQKEKVFYHYLYKDVEAAKLKKEDAEVIETKNNADSDHLRPNKEPFHVFLGIDLEGMVGLEIQAKRAIPSISNVIETLEN